ncbi:MAG TPA: hypothetical protein VGP72_25565 [Planctomycetota bacterium]
MAENELPQQPQAQPASNEPSPWQLAEEGWAELAAAAAKIQAAANAIKKTDRSIDGYNIERSLNKHKPHLMTEHLEGLRQHRKENKL